MKSRLCPLPEEPGTSAGKMEMNNSNLVGEERNMFIW
jgi:hypothetical protein